MDLCFPPPAEVVEESLSPEEFGERASRAWYELRERLFKLERLQSYRQPGNPSYEAFVAGDMRRSLQLIEESHHEDLPLYDFMKERGFSMIRVHVVEHPFSAYLRWELEHYKLTSRLGEDVRLVEQAAIAEFDRATNLSDFMLYDRRFALTLHYDDSGLLERAYAVSDRGYVGQLYEASLLLLSASTRFPP